MFCVDRRRLWLLLPLAALLMTVKICTAAESKNSGESRMYYVHWSIKADIEQRDGRETYHLYASMKGGEEAYFGVANCQAGALHLQLLGGKKRARVYRATGGLMCERLREFTRKGGSFFFEFDHEQEMVSAVRSTGHGAPLLLGQGTVRGVAGSAPAYP